MTAIGAEFDMEGPKLLYFLANYSSTNRYHNEYFAEDTIKMYPLHYISQFIIKEFSAIKVSFDK